MSDRPGSFSLPSPLARVVAALTSRTAYVAAVGTIVVLAVALGTWNSIEYPPHSGYDNESNVGYARLVYDEHRLPTASDEASYYKPPGFFAAAGWLMSQKDDRDKGRKYVQYLNAAFYVAATILVLLLARVVFPSRQAVHLFAGGFFVLLPAVPKLAASFHPAIMSTFFAVAGLLAATWMLVNRRHEFGPSLGLAIILTGGLLVASQNVFVYVSVLLGFLVAAIRRERGSRLRAFLPAIVVVSLTILLAAPFYVRQAIKYGDPVLALRVGSDDTPLLERRPASFYTAPDLAQIFTRPYRPSYNNQFLPTAYSELWGDYFGHWVWSAETPPLGRAERELIQQSGIGVLPTLLGLVGWLAFVAGLVRTRLENSALVPLVALPAVAALGFFYYALAVPSSDGDTIKGSFMLVAAPAWALSFGHAADAVRGVSGLGPAVVLMLVGSALLSLPFVTFHAPLWGLL